MCKIIYKKLFTENITYVNALKNAAEKAARLSKPVSTTLIMSNFGKNFGMMAKLNPFSNTGTAFRD